MYFFAGWVSFHAYIHCLINNQISVWRVCGGRMKAPRQMFQTPLRPLFCSLHYLCGPFFPMYSEFYIVSDELSNEKLKLKSDCM